MIKDFLNSERDGVVTIEYVLIAVMAVALALAIFGILGPALNTKMNSVSQSIVNADASMKLK